MVYRHGDYALYTREVTLRNSNAVQRIYFFARGTPRSGAPCNLPRGYAVGVNPRTGMPYVKKSDQPQGFFSRWFN
jgi:hypothetical protein